jgi:hypothetical protein
MLANPVNELNDLNRRLNNIEYYIEDELKSLEIYKNL